MTPKTQRRLIVGVLVVAGFVVLMNLLAGPGPSMWDHERPYDQNVMASK
jgi:hypothetical protein